MKRKILLTVLALAIVLLATPIIGTVMAEPTKGQKVPARFRLIPPVDVTDEGYSWFTGSGVFHGRARTETYSAKLNISGTIYNAFFVTVMKVSMWNPQQRTMGYA